MSDKYIDLPEGLPDGVYTSRDGKVRITVQSAPAEPDPSIPTVELHITGDETPEEIEAKVVAALQAAGVKPGIEHVRGRIQITSRED